MKVFNKKLISLIIIILYEIGTIVSILQRRKMRDKEVKQFVQDHRLVKGQNL